MLKRKRYSKRGLSFGGVLFITCCICLLSGFYLGLRLIPRHVLANLLGAQGAIRVLAMHIPGGGINTGELFPGNNAQGYKLILAQSSAVLSPVMPVTAEPEFPAQFQEAPGESYTPPLDGDNKEEKPPVKNGELSRPLVAVYCTHNSEAYTPTEGLDKLEGKNAGVFQAAYSIKLKLESLGIGTILCETIHDYPSWAMSYANSLASLKELKEAYPSLQVFVDVHRDVKPAGGTTVLKTEKGRAAKIMLVVGSDKRLEHPNWRQNLAFAQKIGEKLEGMAPGILRGVRVQDGRYNQHFSPYGILLEMGSTENSLEEARFSAEIVAEVLAEAIYEDKNLNKALNKAED